MSDRQTAPQPADPDARAADARAADHAAIDHLAEELVPALIAKLSSTNLGEIEVREGSWRVRLRRSAIGDVSFGRRAADRASRSQPGHEGHDHAPGLLEAHRPARAGGTAGPGAAAAGLAPVGPGRGAAGGTGDGAAHEADRSYAMSPAVGVFQPVSAVSSGSRVKAGDRLGVVEVLGVPHEVVAPADGILSATLVEPGHAVEYGQELIRIEVGASRASGGRDGAAGRGGEASE